MKQQLEQRLKELRTELRQDKKSSVDWKTSRQNLEKHFFE
jgi:hypothetical protein